MSTEMAPRNHPRQKIAILAFVRPQIASSTIQPGTEDTSSGKRSCNLFSDARNPAPTVTSQERVGMHTVRAALNS